MLKLHIKWFQHFYFACISKASSSKAFNSSYLATLSMHTQVSILHEI